MMLTFQGIDYLVSNKCLEKNAKAVASFLLRTSGLSKKAIGDYLGERKDFNLEVLQEFVNLHEFHDVKMESALRLVIASDIASPDLWGFSLAINMGGCFQIMHACSLVQAVPLDLPSSWRRTENRSNHGVFCAPLL